MAIVGRGVVEVPEELCHMIGTFKTENLGIEKIVANIVRRPWIRHLVVCGREEFGHFPGDAMASLHANGVDDDMRIIGTRSPIPFLCNTPTEAIRRFMEQVQLHDLVHPKEAEEIIEYDPQYIFDDDARAELIALLQRLKDGGDSPFDAPPLPYSSSALDSGGDSIGYGLNKVADRIVSGMLGFAEEKLSTTCPFITISKDPDLVINPVDGILTEVPSADLVGRLRDYLTGGM